MIYLHHLDFRTRLNLLSVSRRAQTLFKLRPMPTLVQKENENLRKIVKKFDLYKNVESLTDFARFKPD